MSVGANYLAGYAKARRNEPSRRGEVGPVVRSWVGGLVAFAGLAIALLSLGLPWVSGGGESFSGLALPEVLGLGETTPVNFLGLVVLSLLSAVVLVSRLGIVAIFNGVTAVLVLIAHLAFVWELYGSTRTADPILAGLATEMTVAYGSYVAVVGFLLVMAGSAVAATSAGYFLPDRAEARIGDRD